MAGRRWGFEDSRGLDDWLDGWLPSNGGWYLSDDQKRTTLTTPQAIEAVRWIADQNARDKTVITPADRAALGLAGSGFASGSVGFTHQNSSILGSAPTTTGYDQMDWDVMWTPKAPRTGKGLAHVGDQPHVLPRRPGRTAAQTDAAWLFMTFMSGPEVQALVAEGRGSLPVYKKILAGERFLRRPPAGAAVVGKLAADSAVFSVGWFPGYDQWWAVVRPAAPRRDARRAQRGRHRPPGDGAGDAVLQQLGAPGRLG